MMPEVVPPLKAVVKETCVDAENNEIGAVKPPKEHAVVASHQFRWLVSQVCALQMILKLCSCQLRAWMVSFMHIARNVKVTELNLYEDAILDACCHNIPADDELWRALGVGKYTLLGDEENPWLSMFERRLPCFGCGIEWCWLQLFFIVASTTIGTLESGLDLLFCFCGEFSNCENPEHVFRKAVIFTAATIIALSILLICCVNKRFLHSCAV
ncbi:hypothetical protein EJB05_33208, partial [Eragrostis curvula]